MGFFFQVLPLLADLSACFPGRLPSAALAELCSFGEGLKECRTPREAPRDIWLELCKSQRQQHLGRLDKSIPKGLYKGLGSFRWDEFGGSVQPKSGWDFGVCAPGVRDCKSSKKMGLDLGQFDVLVVLEELFPSGMSPEEALEWTG